MIKCKATLPLIEDIGLPDDLVGLDITIIGDDYQPKEPDVGIMVDYFNQIDLINPEYQELLDKNYDLIMNNKEYEFQELLKQELSK